MARVIGVDHGLRRVGLAVGDEETGMAFPRETVPIATATERIRELAAAEGAALVVIGLPLNMDSTEGDQAANARRFGVQLAALGLVVTYADERLTTWDAEERARAADRPIDRNSIDSAAAALILEQYFADRRRRPQEA
jgi:putative Holliday junction resolvase